MRSEFSPAHKKSALRVCVCFILSRVGALPTAAIVGRCNYSALLLVIPVL